MVVGMANKYPQVSAIEVLVKKNFEFGEFSLGQVWRCGMA